MITPITPSIVHLLTYLLSHTVSSTTIDPLIASLDDTLFTASSYQDEDYINLYCAPYKSKYDIIEGCWCLETTNTTISGEYLQINFDRQVKIYSVGTKGDPLFYEDRYVSSYLFAYSQDGNDFIYYNDAEVLTGNMNYAIEQINNLTPPVIAQYVRFYPLTANVHTSMKVEAYGCDLSLTPTQHPTLHPIKPPSTETPSNNPTKNPSTNPSANPSEKPTIVPSSNPVNEEKDATSTQSPIQSITFITSNVNDIQTMFTLSTIAVVASESAGISNTNQQIVTDGDIWMDYLVAIAVIIVVVTFVLCFTAYIFASNKKNEPTVNQAVDDKQGNNVKDTIGNTPNVINVSAVITNMSKRSTRRASESSTFSMNNEHMDEAEQYTNRAQQSKEEMLVEEWLKTIGLSEYYDVFISNGFGAIHIVKEIASKNELENIGIMVKEHQELILSEIKAIHEEGQDIQNIGDTVIGTTNDTTKYTKNMNVELLPHDQQR